MNTDYNGNPIGVGDVAHNIESGWPGVVLGFELIRDDAKYPFAKMIGINHLAIYIEKRRLCDALDNDDIRWYAPRDLIVDIKSADIKPPWPPSC